MPANRARGALHQGGLRSVRLFVGAELLREILAQLSREQHRPVGRVVDESAPTGAGAALDQRSSTSKTSTVSPCHTPPQAQPFIYRPTRSFGRIAPFLHH